MSGAKLNCSHPVRFRRLQHGRLSHLQNYKHIVSSINQLVNRGRPRMDPSYSPMFYYYVGGVRQAYYQRIVGSDVSRESVRSEARARHASYLLFLFFMVSRRQKLVFSAGGCSSLASSPRVSPRRMSRNVGARILDLKLVRVFNERLLKVAHDLFPDSLLHTEVSLQSFNVTIGVLPSYCWLSPKMSLRWGMARSDVMVIEGVAPARRNLRSQTPHHEIWKDGKY
ncbi:hypothetical protein HW555_007995 [Spodoptera exigua]|uniref:Uncharacterized protein n=1 Tax=Spodoptera exigua TaxID=7107 RepID=A0A835GDE0_SPOEX|nr:hypothetical protein HW555_007995 [Spodoptera exigua]